MGQTGKAPSNPISTRADAEYHAEYQRHQGKVTSCYPDERWLEDHAGTSLWSLIAAFFQMSELYI